LSFLCSPYSHPRVPRMPGEIFLLNTIKPICTSLRDVERLCHRVHKTRLKIQRTFYASYSSGPSLRRLSTVASNDLDSFEPSQLSISRYVYVRIRSVHDTSPLSGKGTFVYSLLEGYLVNKLTLISDFMPNCFVIKRKILAY